ncbi:DgyrCDS1851 [Dimorphilus gyrociliatus]|uniref:Serine racemase n=1 Tax=Dimorphilus gyrociliatus TaxID=2664684 RepID=A0A7I8VAK1_9ANNE|nr:DgyrCDS1851 [Dimorphilus gyrociliatus]
MSEVLDTVDSGDSVTDEELSDPFCDPNDPQVVPFQEVSAAAYKIKSATTGINIYFKREFLQYTGSFKERGARYTLQMLSEEKKKLGVIAASAGNHAQALAYHGVDLGIPVTVVMPIIAPIMKVTNCKSYGANVIVHGADLGEAKTHALKLAKIKGYTYINGYDHPHIIAGQGTCGLEILEQVSDVDAVVVPVGGAGLIAGIALAIKSLNPSVTVIGVESERCASFKAALEAGKPVYTKVSSTIADGLAVPVVGVNAFATASKYVDKTIVVSEEFIALAILRLVEQEKAVVEGAGATGLAAILEGKLDELKGKRVVIPLCGGNIDTTVLGRCLERGLAADGRLITFSVQVSDRAGGIAELTRLIASIGVSIKDIFHERAWLKNDIYSVINKCVVETRDEDHAKQLEELLKTHYSHIKFGPIQL